MWFKGDYSLVGLEILRVRDAHQVMTDLMAFCDLTGDVEAIRGHRPGTAFTDYNHLVHSSK